MLNQLAPHSAFFLFIVEVLPKREIPNFKIRKIEMILEAFSIARINCGLATLASNHPH